MLFRLTDIKKHLRVLDFPLILAVLISCSLGLLLVKSATNYTDSLRYVFTQIIAVACGVIAMYVISTFDYEHVTKYAKWFFAASVAALVITLIFGTGDEIGSRSWLKIEALGIGIQPSEFVKILFIITYAKHLDLIKNDKNNIKNVLFLCLHAGIIIGLVMLQRDLGTAIVFMIIFAVMNFWAGLSLWYFLVGISAVVLSSPFIWPLLREHQRRRILVGFNPESDPEGYGFQVIRAKTAIGSGGLFGAGYQQGTITQNNLLPLQRNDCIFAVAGEEFGFVGTMVIIALLSFIIIRIFHLAYTSRNELGSYICAGIGAMFMFQTIENIGMCLGLLPVIGLTLPFFSGGGSSIFSLFVAIGVVLAVRARRDIYYFSWDGLVK